MSIAGSVIGVILAAGFIFSLLYPFFNARRQSQQEQADRLVSLRVHYDRVLTNLKDLEEDLSLGKIEQEFYEGERAKFLQEGVHLLQEIEQLQPLVKKPAAKPESTAQQDDAIEALIRSKRQESR